MEGTEETNKEAQEEIEAEKKELGDLIQDIIKSLEALKKEVVDIGGVRQVWLEKKITEIMERQSNITENQQKLFDQLNELKEAKNT